MQPLRALRDAALPIVNDPTFGIVPDIKNPYYGPSQTSYDAGIGYRRKFQRVSWSVQLNVRNLGAGDELIPVSAQPDGTPNSGVSANHRRGRCGIRFRSEPERDAGGGSPMSPIGLSCVT